MNSFFTMPSLPCMCASLRRASRSVTQRYEEALRGTGLRATQFTVLQALSLAGEVTQGDLGHILSMDSTTLTRTLRIMRRKGWLAERRGRDRRERHFRLAKAGRDQFTAALPAWRKAQRQLRAQLGERNWIQLMKLSNEVTRLSRHH